MEAAAAVNAWCAQNATPFSFSLGRRHHRPVDFAFKKRDSISCAVVGAVFPSPVSRTATGSRSISCCSSSSSSGSSGWDWNRWTRHFAEIEQDESFSSVLKFQLEDALEKEDFEEAARLKRAIMEATSKDTVADIMSQLQDAIKEERYRVASRLCKLTGSGLVGWWVGLSNDSSDPFGRIVQITPSVGRFVARNYSPRQLLTSSPGTPLFEIYVVKEADEEYSVQVVFLRSAKSSITKSTVLPSVHNDDPSASNSKNFSVKDIPSDGDLMEKSEEKQAVMKSIDTNDVNKDGIKSIINFLQDRIPGLKLKVMEIDAKDEMKEGETLEQLVQENVEDANLSEDSEEGTNGLDDEVTREGIQGGTDSREEERKKTPMKLFIGGVLQNKEDSLPKTFVRLPAEIHDIEKDSFTLHIPETDGDPDFEVNKVSKHKVAAIAAQAVSELMPLDVAKAFWNVDKFPSTVSRDVREVVKLAVSQAQRRNRLSATTIFNRINASNDNLDPFEGLYVGAFGPYGTEVVQLKRKFGQWPCTDKKEGSDVEFFEYVEAVKLIGDINVPAGEATFYAKVGRGSRLPNRGIYPEELGVVASYGGRGRIAKPGFQNPQWVDGELLQLNGKGMGQHVRGAELGFLYVVPEQSFLVLFDRLKLPE